MAENFRQSVLRIVIAQLSQAVGFDSIQSSSLEILTNVLERYLLHIGRTIHDYSEQRLDTVPNLDDVWFALRQLDISLPDIIDYTKQIESVKFPHNVAQFPAPKNSNMGFPTSLNSEVLNREEHVPLHMPSMELSSLQHGDRDAQSDNLLTKKDSFVIAKQNPQNFSSDEDIYSAGENSSDESISDDSLSYNPTKSRRLIKPEDIPMVEGTAPSSLMSVPSVSELEDARSFSASSRRSSVDKYQESDQILSKDKNSFGTRVSSNTPPVPFSNVPWIKPTPTKQQPVESVSHSADNNFRSSDPSWLSQKKKPTDVYDPGWLQDDDSSPVHLHKPPTPDVPISNVSTEKKSRFSRDKHPPSDVKLNKPFLNKKHSNSSKYSKGQIPLGPNIPPHKHSSKPSMEKKHSHQKKYKTSPVMKKPGDDEQIKAQIEAAERLLQNAPVPPQMPLQSSPTPPHMSANPKPPEKKSFHSPAKTALPSTANYGAKPSKKGDVAHSKSEEISISAKPENLHASKAQDDKQDRMAFASSKSMYDAIDAVINRATEESVRQDKEAEEAELMKFSHLVEDSSSSDSESDVSLKAEQMLQLQERGLQETHPPPADSPSLSSFSMDDPPSPLVDSASNDSIKVSHKKPDTTADKGKSKANKKEKHKKKSKHKDGKSSLQSHPEGHGKSKKNKQKQTSFVTTETISPAPAPVKMKVKLKPLQPKEPKLFDVCDDKDRIKITHSSKPPKEEKHKSKDSKSSKSKDYKNVTAKTSTEVKRDKSEKEHSVGKIILKKSKSGDAKVVKPKVKEHKEHTRSPSPIANRSNLPLPKLSAAVPVTSVTVTAKEKEKKKLKKEKKKKKDRDRDRSTEREKYHEKTKESKDKQTHMKESKSSGWDSRSSSRRESFESDVPSPLVPKLTLKLGGSEKEFVIKPSGSSSKTSKKRPHLSGTDNAKPAKERKISVECVKTVSEGFAAAVERKVVTQTISVGPGPVGVYEDDEGNKIWICPGCNKPDDGSPMIGCDACDDWFHWPCVKITEEPPDDVDWFCPRCTKRQQRPTKTKVSTKKKKKK